MAGSVDNTDILAGLNQVIQALNDLDLTSNCTPQIVNNISMTCNCGSGGAGGTAEPTDTDTGDPSDPQGDPPPGFASWNEYHTYKCNVATKIIDDLLADWQWYQSVNLYGLAAVALAAALLTPVPGDEIIVLVGILGAIVGYGTTIFQDVEDAIQNNYDNFVCILYNAPNATQAESDLEDAFATALDVETSDVISRWEGKQGFNTMVGPAALNRLFDKDEALTGRLPTGDCSGCAGCPEYNLIQGTYDPQTGYASSIYYGQYSPPREQVAIYFNHDGSNYCGDPITLEITEITGTPNSSANGYRIFDQAGNSLYTSVSSPPSGPVSNVGRISLLNDVGPTPFTVQLEIT